MVQEPHETQYKSVISLFFFNEMSCYSLMLLGTTSFLVHQDLPPMFFTANSCFIMHTVLLPSAVMEDEAWRDQSALL